MPRGLVTCCNVYMREATALNPSAVVVCVCELCVFCGITCHGVASQASLKISLRLLTHHISIFVIFLFVIQAVWSNMPVSGSVRVVCVVELCTVIVACPSYTQCVHCIYSRPTQLHIAHFVVHGTLNCEQVPLQVRGRCLTYKKKLNSA